MSILIDRESLRAAFTEIVGYGMYERECSIKNTYPDHPHEWRQEYFYKDDQKLSVNHFKCSVDATVARLLSAVEDEL